MPPIDRLLFWMIDKRRNDEELVAMGFEPAFVERITGMVAGAEYKRRVPPIAKLGTRTTGVDYTLSATTPRIRQTPAVSEGPGAGSERRGGPDQRGRRREAVSRAGVGDHRAIRRTRGRPAAGRQELGVALCRGHADRQPRRRPRSVRSRSCAP